jgi:uncharacterized protein Usg|tara:strand:+ start:349 stop:603 length:255 start_codon:yes stop_codon:yes gene_type:complete
MAIITDISQSIVLVTILYKTPDLPHLIQEFNYEGHDVPPEYPYFDKFMDYWRDNIPSIILDIKGLCHQDITDRYVHLQDRLVFH